MYVLNIVLSRSLSKLIYYIAVAGIGESWTFELIFGEEDLYMTHTLYYTYITTIIDA